MKKHSLKILDQLAPNTEEDDTDRYVYGLCSCGQPVQGGRNEDELREHHAEHVAAAQ